LWSPQTPFLYDLIVEAGEDQVESYFGMRKFSIGKDKQGRTCLCLNNQPFFQFGPLDQGYWPDGLYTPPTDDAMRWDLEMIKSLGFNMLRKHVKVEPARYYYYCDTLVQWQ
jgi:beta-galactosidase/beta-glucuronidase